MTLLGFSGVLPNVSLNVPDISLPVGITFVITADPGSGPFPVAFQVVEDSTGRVVSKPEDDVTVVLNPKNSANLLAVGTALVYGKRGKYRFGMLVAGNKHYEATFELT